MAGVRKRLRDITTRVSGAIAGPRDEGDPTAAEPADEPVEDTDEVTTTPASVVELEQPPAADVPDALDRLCAEAVDLARAVAVEAGGAAVGEHLGIESEGPLVATHSFATTDKAYVGWRWAVTVARAEGDTAVTVDEVVLLPGSGALLAPAWVPWSERVQPGDLAPGDLLPPAPDDPRLVASYADPEAELAADVFWELGLGRPRVMSLDGRFDAAERWYDGTQGPSSSMARQAPGQCVGCGFLLPMAGGMRTLFGVCGNAMAPDDGRVVSLDHGCGAHSETQVELTHGNGAGMVVEEEELEFVPSGASSPDDETPDGHAS